MINKIWPFAILSLAIACGDKEEDTAVEEEAEEVEEAEEAEEAEESEEENSEESE